jgi:hypothetical protein
MLPGICAASTEIFHLFLFFIENVYDFFGNKIMLCVWLYDKAICIIRAEITSATYFFPGSPTSSSMQFNLFSFSRLLVAFQQCYLGPSAPTLGEIGRFGWKEFRERWWNTELAAIEAKIISDSYFYLVVAKLQQNKSIISSLCVYHLEKM